MVPGIGSPLVRLADIKPSLIRYDHCVIKVASTLKLLPESSIVLELGKQG